MERTNPTPQHRAFKAALALLLCLACIPGQSLTFAQQAWAEATTEAEAYAVVYKPTENATTDYVLVFQQSATENPDRGIKVSCHPIPDASFSAGEWNTTGIEAEERKSIASIVSDKDVTIPAISHLRLFAENLESVDLTGLVLPGLTSTASMFRDCSQLRTADLSSIDTSSVADMSSMFYNCSKLSSLSSAGWDTSSVTDMHYMFCECRNLSSLSLEGWNTSSVTDMHYMFAKCTSLPSSKLCLSTWDTSNVRDMKCMFAGCSKLTELNLSNWDTSNVTDMSLVFSQCEKLTELDVAGWDTSSATTLRSMFDGCKMLTNLDLANWDTSSVTDMDYLFANCISLGAISLANWSTSCVEDMSNMFYKCENLTYLDLSTWDTSRVEDMRYMFEGTSSLQAIDLSSFTVNDTCKVSNGFFSSATSSLYLSPSAAKVIGNVLSIYGKWEDADGNELTKSQIVSLGSIGKPVVCYRANSPKAIFPSFVQDIPDMTYSGKPCEPSVAVWFGNEILAKGADYTVSYENNSMPGIGRAIITGIGNYTNVVTKPFVIISPDGLERPGQADSDTPNQSDTNPGSNSTGSAGSSTGSGSAGGSGSGAGSITPNEATPPLSGITVGGTGVGGASIPTAEVGTRPPVSISVGGRQLVEGTDYSVHFVGGSSVGPASLVLTGLGANKWSYTVRYIVLPAGTTVSKATLGKKSTRLAWRKQASQTDGYQVRYSTKKSMRGAKTKTVKGAKKTSAKLPRVKTGKSLYVQVRTYRKAGGKTYFSPWSARTRVSNPPATSVSKLKKAKRGFTVKWKKQPKKWMTGYQVRYSTKKSMKGAKKLTVKGASKTSAKVSKLKGGKKYYVQVRTYKKVSKKTYYSGWSNAKTVKTKK